MSAVSTLLFCCNLAIGAENEQASWYDGYLKIGYGYKSITTPYFDQEAGGSLFLSGRYQVYPGFFIEASHGANELDQGINLGFNFYNSENWSFDLLTIRGHGENVYAFGHNDIQLLKERKSATNMLGARATAIFDRSTLQFTVAPYSFSDRYDNGVYASLWGSHSWQLKNWSIHGSLGAEFRSRGMLDYYYSTSKEMESIGIPHYQAESGINIVSQVSASYPISTHMLFETYTRYTRLASSISDNPIMQMAANLDDRQKHISEFGILVSYVF